MGWQPIEWRWETESKETQAEMRGQSHGTSLQQNITTVPHCSILTRTNAFRSKGPVASREDRKEEKETWAFNQCSNWNFRCKCGLVANLQLGDELSLKHQQPISVGEELPCSYKTGTSARYCIVQLPNSPPFKFASTSTLLHHFVRDAPANTSAPALKHADHHPSFSPLPPQLRLPHAQERGLRFLRSHQLQLLLESPTPASVCIVDLD